MKKIILISITFFACTFYSFAQGKIEFKKIKHEFGQIQEEGGPAVVDFEFTNTGNSTIKLTNVQASCGCTTPKWSKDPIEPGKTGIITASYDPMNRPGKFTKNISVSTDGEPNFISLTIEGDVIPRKKGVKDWYPAEDGNLRFTTKNFYFQKVYQDATATQKITIYNQGEQVVNLNMADTKATLPPHITLSVDKTKLNPKDSAKMELVYNPKIKNDWGMVSDPFDLKTDDGAKAIKKMYVSANIVENFGNFTANTPAPKIKFDKEKHDFGKINQNTRNTTAFTLKNEGNKPLIIRKTKASCGCTASEPKKTTLAPGESTTIEIVYSSGTKKGKQTQNVTVISNDPLRPELRLTVEAEINEPTPVTITPEAPKKQN